MPFAVLTENPIPAIDPLALLGTFELNSSSIEIPKRVNSLLGAFYISCISVRTSMPPQIAVPTDNVEGAFW
jgi:hypothetical protein